MGLVQDGPTNVQQSRHWWCLALVLLGYVGYFKGSYLLAGMPVDATVTSAAAVVVGISVQILKRAQYARVPLARILALFAALAPGVAISGNLGKSLLLFTITLACAVAPCYFLLEEKAQWSLLLTTVVAAIAMGVAAYAFPDVETQEFYGRLSLAGSDTIATGRVIGAGVVVVVALSLFPSNWRLLLVALGVVGVGVMAAVGSRGPLMGMIAAVAGILLSSRGLKGIRVKAVGIGIALACIAVWIVSIMPTGGGARVVAFLAGNEDDDGRSRLAEKALALIPTHPFGLGWGGFASLGFLSGDRPLSYPHNLLLEVTLEGGWIACVAFILIATLSMRGFISSSGSPAGIALLGLGIYWITVAQTSSDINGNRMTWVVLCTGLVLGSRNIAVSESTPEAER